MFFGDVDFSNYMDGYNLIVQHNEDAGDCCNRTTAALVMDRVITQKSIGNYYESAMRKFECGFGLFRRSADPEFWGSNPNNFSIEQMMNALSAMVIYGDWKRLLRTFLRTLFRFGFCQNTVRNDDETQKWKVPDMVLLNPHCFALFIRGLRLYPLYPLLWVCDAGFYFDLKLREDDRWDADVCLVPMMMASLSVWPTYFGKKMFKKYYGTDWNECVWQYQQPEVNGILPMFYLYTKAMDLMNGDLK